MKEFLRDLWAGNWQPNRIFYAVRAEGKMDYTHVKPKYEVTFHQDFTPLGEWFKNRAAILHIVKWPYYVVVWPLFLALQCVRVVVELFYKPL